MNSKTDLRHPSSCSSSRSVNDDKTIGHIPKDMSKITYFFLKADGKFDVEITGPRQYSRDLIQGGMELP